MSIYDKSINWFLGEAISDSPTPGGASVAAVAGTLACSMVGMVASLTINKKAYAQYQIEAEKVLEQCRYLTRHLQELTQQDMVVFEDYMKAFRMPKGSGEEKAARGQALEIAAKNATMVPMAICGACLDILRQALSVSGFGNKMAISDAGVGVHLALGALKAAMLNVDVNLGSLNDREFIDATSAQRKMLVQAADSVSAQALALIRERMA